MVANKPLQGWTRYQLITLLVQSGIELRQEKTVPTEVLYSFADAVSRTLRLADDGGSTNF
jgi:hypothetical protein